LNRSRHTARARARTIDAAAVKARAIAVLLSLMAAIVVLASGAAHGQAILATTPQGPPASLDPGNYRIGPQDKLNITVFQVKDLTVEKIEVDASGQILLPLIGSVQAQGMTTTELSKEIARRLGEKYLQNPQVSVVVEEASSQKVTVEGAVNEAGVFQLRGRTSLLEAVAMAKGPSHNADPRHVAIIRIVDGESKAAVFDITAIQHGKARNPEILGNDIVVINDSKTKQFWHELVTSLPAFLIFSYL
jgi:polysaccharide export outer membrane protein